MKKHFSYLLLYSLVHSMPIIIKGAQAPDFSTVYGQNAVQIADLKPEIVWNYFNTIAQIPRISGQEQEIANYVMGIAAQHGLEAVQDSVGNVVVSKPASSAVYADRPGVVIQCHIDMVTEKNDGVSHNFATDPIRFVRKENMLYADGTTLGADNGVGVAICLAIIAAKDLVHGPLEFLFTVQEETTFAGANAINEQSFNGRMLINVDAEVVDDVYIGSAGSYDVVGTLQVTRQVIPTTTCYKLTIDGLKGGHSGVGIHETDRLNALKITAELLASLPSGSFNIVSLRGGKARNAIPRFMEVVLAADISTLESAIEQLKATYTAVEPGLTITLQPVESTQGALSAQDQERILQLLQTIPHGVRTWSEAVDYPLVETSTNLANIKTEGDSVIIETMQRSLVVDGLEQIRDDVQQVFATFGAQTTIKKGSPTWQPNPDSRVLRYARERYKRLRGTEVNVKAIHAGLECGAFNVPGLDAISSGPTIIDPHSPSEHIDVTTVHPYYAWLVGTLEDIAQGND